MVGRRGVAPIAGAHRCRRHPPAVGRKTIDSARYRRSAVLAARWMRAIVSGRPRRIPRDLAHRRVGGQPRVVHDVVVAVAEQVGADVDRDHPRAQDEERDDQQRRDDADEDVGQDQLAPDPPQQPPLEQQEQPRHEEPDRQDQPDRRRTAEHFDRRRARSVTRRRTATANFSDAATTNSRPGQVCSSSSRGDGIGSSGGGRYPGSSGGGRRLGRGLRGVGGAACGLVSRPSGSRHNSRAGHPASRRCSSLRYARYPRSSRLAIRAPRPGFMPRSTGTGH